jgi:hypothetical protein
MRIRVVVLLLALACTQPKEGSHAHDSGADPAEGMPGSTPAETGGASGKAGGVAGTGGAVGTGGGGGGATGGATGTGGGVGSGGSAGTGGAGTGGSPGTGGAAPADAGVDVGPAPPCGALNQVCCNGTCSAGYTCKAGTCAAACVPGGACGTNDMCKKSQISCDTGSPVCVSIAINEGIACSPRKCKGTTDVVEGRCSGGTCTETNVQSCGSTRTCTGNQCKKKNGQPCSSSSECANNNCNGPRFCVGGSNDHCPCSEIPDEMCESGPSACKVDQSMKTCGGGDCTNWSCNGTPPAMNTCDIHN